MRFNPKADISGGRVSGSRGGGGGGLGGLGGALGGGRGLPIPGGLGLKGTIVVIILYVVLQMCTGGKLPGPGLGAGDGGQQADDGTYDTCNTGEDANTKVECARVGVVESIENYWAAELPKHGHDFKAAPVITFTDNVTTACGAASSGMGPFYCPGDQTIYEDPRFYEDVFEGQLGGENDAFVEAYVLGHEYGHHISTLIGDIGKASGEGIGSGAVNLELQADCFAGLWTQHAESVPDDKGQVLIEALSDQDIDAAIKAAKTVGDDYIQQRTQGKVDEEGWTHGSSQQRMDAFQLGYTGDFDSCSWSNVKSEVNS